MTDERNVKDNGFVVGECEITKTGQCAMHGIEVERRKSIYREIQKEITDLKANLIRIQMDFEKELIDLKSKIKTIKDDVAVLNNSKSKIFVVSTLGVLIILGNYYYTNSHISEAHMKYAEISAAFRTIDAEQRAQDVITTANRETLARNEERYKGIDSRLGSIDSSLRQVLGLMLREERITSDQLMSIRKEK